MLQIFVLAAVQGAAELLPVSSSAHVIVAAKLMGLNPTTPEMTLLLVMLHTGTMFAVIIYFWKSWRENFFPSRRDFWRTVKLLLLATVLTGVVGLALKALIERLAFGTADKAEIEMLFGNLGLVSGALAAVGVLIIYAGLLGKAIATSKPLGVRQAAVIGAVQGLCLPLRGFSRSGATISAGLLLGIAKERVESFSFALAVVLTPPVIAREAVRLLKAQAGTGTMEGGHLVGLFVPGMCGMVMSCLSGLFALKWLSGWLEEGRWHYFGYYCLVFSFYVLLLHTYGV